MKKLVLFDLDGTLIDTIGDLGEAVNHAMGLRGYPFHSTEEYKRMVGHGVRNLVRQAMPVENRDDEALVDSCLADFKRYYSDHIDVLTRPYPGIPELLSGLDRRGIKMAVVSNKFQEGTEHLIQEFFPGISFVSILGNREGFPLKPDPAIVREVLDKSGLEASDAIMVGDSMTDMKTAANGGIDSIAVAWGYRPEGDFAEYRIVRTVEELSRVLFSI